MTGDRRFGLTVAALGAFLFVVACAFAPSAVRSGSAIAVSMTAANIPLTLALTVLGARIATDAEGAA